jgi:hypothetical protein
VDGRQHLNVNNKHTTIITIVKAPKPENKLKKFVTYQPKKRFTEGELLSACTARN